MPEGKEYLEHWLRVDESVREMIRHENNLLNQRVTWLCQVEVLLFAAAGVLWDKPESQRLICGLAVFGVCFAISAWFGCRMAALAVAQLSDAWRFPDEQKGARPPVLGLQVKEDPFWRWFRLLWPWNFLPLLFVLAWAFVAYVHQTRQQIHL